MNEAGRRSGHCGNLASARDARSATALKETEKLFIVYVCFDCEVSWLPRARQNTLSGLCGPVGLTSMAFVLCYHWFLRQSLEVKDTIPIVLVGNR